MTMRLRALSRLRPRSSVPLSRTVDCFSGSSSRLPVCSTVRLTRTRRPRTRRTTSDGAAWGRRRRAAWYCWPEGGRRTPRRRGWRRCTGSSAPGGPESTTPRRPRPSNTCHRLHYSRTSILCTPLFTYFWFTYYFFEPVTLYTYSNLIYVLHLTYSAYSVNKVNWSLRWLCWRISSLTDTLHLRKKI